MAAGTTAVSISLDGRFENFYHSRVVGADAFREDRVFPRSAKKLPGRLLMDEPAKPGFSAADPSSPPGGEAASPWPDWRCILLLVLLTLAMRVWQVCHTEVIARDTLTYIRMAWQLEHGPVREVLRDSPHHPGYPGTIMAMSWLVRPLAGKDLVFAMQLSTSWPAWSPGPCSSSPCSCWAANGSVNGSASGPRSCSSVCPPRGACWAMACPNRCFCCARPSVYSAARGRCAQAR